MSSVKDSTQKANSAKVCCHQQAQNPRETSEIPTSPKALLISTSEKNSCTLFSVCGGLLFNSKKNLCVVQNLSVPGLSNLFHRRN
uniref:Clone 1200 transcribed RNA sequence n=1 Tax=Plectreurys tristis TaxID=33319 RepID=A0A0C4W4E0_PLETR|nr:salivary-like protein [Plectreurys tristis]